MNETKLAIGGTAYMRRPKSVSTAVHPYGITLHPRTSLQPCNLRPHVSLILIGSEGTWYTEVITHGRSDIEIRAVLKVSPCSEARESEGIFLLCPLTLIWSRSDGPATARIKDVPTSYVPVPTVSCLPGGRDERLHRLQQVGSQHRPEYQQQTRRVYLLFSHTFV
ncbi:hypothetical protein MPTK1_4g10550 [Marchantia polymorpha subsp. ruderalis]|uniref:Uncharacterized protein n=2 Tax=Marchantia polymorpha TaxID=3197 RepID=A0AAF6B8H5_MARPO|nr:hypothetical protein MARPO_0011s0041 [Marchantia polymorpha]BBN08309.1 hypothetical protein Mp_4g10550 [Marchantia polymorpha subsp. ruderalis]|eukprot:PTQ46344.1 hypothetical protein MARPO_0011s0041 [Marchantia polymorpha]